MYYFIIITETLDDCHGSLLWSSGQPWSFVQKSGGGASVMPARASWKSYLLCFRISLAPGGSKSFTFYGTSANFKPAVTRKFSLLIAYNSWWSRKSRLVTCGGSKLSFWKCRRCNWSWNCIPVGYA